MTPSTSPPTSTDPPVHFRRSNSGSAFVIELLKPRSLNALDLEAFRLIDQALDEAASDDQIELIVIWAPVERSPRAFCAGGDVRRLFEEHQKSGNLDYGSAFFDAEYRVDRRVWEFSKPIVALTHGITMGGGIGLIRGAPYRVACETSVWAMPEISIGLYPDVGATGFLSLLAEPWPAFLSLTGARVSPADLLELGLATHLVPQKDLPQLLAELEELSTQSGELLEQIEATLARHQTPRSGPGWFGELDAIREVFGSALEGSVPQSAERIWRSAEALHKTPGASSGELNAALETLLSGSPLSVLLILEQLRAGRRLVLNSGQPDWQKVFAWETEASIRCMRDGDFFEGVRSRLVDKDFREPGKPRWKYAAPFEVPDEQRLRLFPSTFSG